MMTRRRTPISIYDYPEHLNPFREDVDESENVKYHTTGRRRSSFRVSAWTVFASRGKSPERSTATPSPVASRFLTWTPKLLRRASFRRTITPAPQIPPEHKNALSPSPRTMPARPPIPTHFNSTTNSSPAPVPAVRTRRLAQRAGGEDETKYIQQGAKPKKKRRAPAPPTPHPGRASQPQEPEISCNTTQEQPQSSGEQEIGATSTSVECYVEQSSISPPESEEASSAVASETAAEAQLELVTQQSDNSLATSEESAGERESVMSPEASGQPENESAPITGEDTGERDSEEFTVEINTSQMIADDSTPQEEVMETVTRENEVDITDQISVNMTQSNTESTVGEPENVHQKQFAVENLGNEVESSSQNNTKMENTGEKVNDVSASSAGDSSVIVENASKESSLRDEECENGNSLTDILKEHVDPEDEKDDGDKSLTNTPLENGFGGSDSETSPSKADLIDEESKPLPKPRTILPEKLTEQDKKP